VITGVPLCGQKGIQACRRQGLTTAPGCFWPRPAPRAARISSHAPWPTWPWPGFRRLL